MDGKDYGFHHSLSNGHDDQIRIFGDGEFHHLDLHWDYMLFTPFSPCLLHTEQSQDRRVGYEGQKSYFGIQPNHASQQSYDTPSWTTSSDPYLSKPAYNPHYMTSSSVRPDMTYYGNGQADTFNQYGGGGFNGTKRHGKYDDMGMNNMLGADTSNNYYAPQHLSYQETMMQQQMKRAPPQQLSMPQYPSQHQYGMQGMQAQINRGPARNTMPNHMNGGMNPNPYLMRNGAVPNPMGAYGGPAGTGGSNAQGRAINKMLLEIVRERVIDPQRLDLAIETYVERMDCVNLATLLFHTGKKRLLLIPTYIKRIANRFVTLKEELRAREASNALYGLKCMSSEIVEVRELVYALANKVAGSTSDFVAQAVGNALYGLQMMTSDHEEVRFMLSVLAGKVSRCTELLEAQNVGNALYGLRNMSSDHREVRAVIAALTPKIATAREDLNGQALGNSLYGLQSMCSKESEVRFLLAVLATKVTRTWEDLKAQEVGNALYGLKRMSTDVPEVRILISALVPKVAASPEILDAQAIGNSFYGLQNMRSDNAEVLSLLAVMAEKVALSCPELDGQAMGNSLYGLQGMSSDHPEVRAVVSALTAKMQASCLDMNAQEMGNALYGMQNMTSEHADVRRLMTALTHKVNSSKHDLLSQEIGNAMFGLQGMSSSVWETRMLVRQIAIKIQQSHSIIDPLGVSNSLYGLQRMSSESEDVRLLVQALAIKIEHSWKLLSAQHIANALYGLQGLCSAENEVRYLIKTLVPKVLSCRDEMTAKQVSQAIFGLRNFSSDHPEVLALINALAEKVATSSEPWQLHHLSMVLYGMQGLSSSKEEVAALLGAVAHKAQALIPEKQVDVNALANALLGMQRMSSNNADVCAILNVLSNKLAAVPSSSAVNAKVCANLIYGMQGCSCANDTVKNMLYFLADHIQQVTGTFMTTPRTKAEKYGVDKTGESINPVDRIEDILALYQATTLSLFALRDLEADADLQARMYAEMSALRSIIDIHKSEVPVQPLTAAEKRMTKELGDVLAHEPFAVANSVLVDGFEMAAYVQLLPNIQLKTTTGSNWTPMLNIEVRGSSYTSPAKDLFYRLRKHFLEQEKGIVVDTVPADSFRIEGQQGLKIHSAVLSPLYPPTLEDANNFTAKLAAMGMSGHMGVLSLGSENFFSFNGSPTMDHSIDLSTVGLPPQEYHDDDFKRSVVSSFNDSKKYKFNANARAQKAAHGMPLAWVGDWPVVTQPVTSNHNGGSSGNSPVLSHKTLVDDRLHAYAQQSSTNSNLLNRGDLSLNSAHQYPVNRSFYQQQGEFGANTSQALPNPPQQAIGQGTGYARSPQGQQSQQQGLRHSDDESSTSSNSLRDHAVNHNQQLRSSNGLNDPRFSLGSGNNLNTNLKANLSLTSLKITSPQGMSTSMSKSRSSELQTPTSSAHTIVLGFNGSSSLNYPLNSMLSTDREDTPGPGAAAGPCAPVQEGSEMDDEIAALEAQLEVARLEARIKELRSKKVTK